MEGKLKRVGADGGPVQTICESGSGFFGAWSRDGTILFTKEFGTPIVAVSASGGTPRPVTALDAARGEVAHFHPAFLPDGRHFVFVARNIDPGEDLRHARVARFEGGAAALPRRLRRDLRDRRATCCLRATTRSSPGGSIRGSLQLSGQPVTRDRAGPLRNRRQPPVGLGGRRPPGLPAVDGAAPARLGGSQGARARHARRRRRVRRRPPLARRPEGRRRAARSVARTERGRLGAGRLPRDGRHGSPPSAPTSSHRRGSRTANGWSTSPITWASTISTSGRRAEAPRRSLVATKQDKILPSISPDGKSLLYCRCRGRQFRARS